MVIPEFERRFSFGLFAAFCAVWPAAYFFAAALLPPDLPTLAQPFFFLAPALWFRRRFGLKEIPARGGGKFRRMAFVIAATAPLSLALNFLLPRWLEFLSVPPEFFEQIFAPLLHKGSIWGGLADVACLVLLPAWCEEYFFRGLLLPGLAAKAGGKTAVALAALVFALYHLNPYFLPFYFALGLWFGGLAARGGRLSDAVVAHATNNAVGLALYYGWG